MWSLQEKLRQKLIDEPLLEYQEQFSEDLVQPMTREDALALTDLLTNSLPLGSIQVGLGHSLVVMAVLHSVRQSAEVSLLASYPSLCLNAWPEMLKSDVVVFNRYTSIQTGSDTIYGLDIP